MLNKIFFSPTLLTLIFLSTSYGMEYGKIDMGNLPGRASIERTLKQKIQEINNNNEFFLTAMDPKFESIRSAWADLGALSAKEIEAAKQCPKIPITIAGIEIEAYDISDRDYMFHIHTTPITVKKAALLEKYILSQRNEGDKRTCIQDLNFDICPLFSTSVVDAHTDGYDSNFCNTGLEPMINLIIRVDPMSINHSGPTDIYSPAKNAIERYLNNIGKYKEKYLGRETMTKYFAKNMPTIDLPENLISDIRTQKSSGFNEIVVCGNSYTHFFKNSKDVEILGISLSSYWLNQRQNPNVEDVKALKKLGDILPIIYTDAKEAKSLFNKIQFGYIKPNECREILKRGYENIQYSSKMEGLNPRGLKNRVRNLESFYFRTLCPKEFEALSDKYESFVLKYNDFIRYIYDEINYDHNDMLQLYKETMISDINLSLAVTKIMLAGGNDDESEDNKVTENEWADLIKKREMITHKRTHL